MEKVSKSRISILNRCQSPESTLAGDFNIEIDDNLDPPLYGIEQAVATRIVVEDPLVSKIIIRAEAIKKEVSVIFSYIHL